MCNRYGYLAPVSRLVEEFSQTRIPLRFHKDAIPHLEPRDEIAPSEPAPIIRLGDDGAQLDMAAWGLLPRAAKGPLVINMRAESRQFERGRCLIPATHFFEFTGKRYPKTRWRFTKAGEDVFAIAGVLGRGGSVFSMLTVAPGPDILPFHDRQVAIVERRNWERWLEGAPSSDLLGPAPAGTLAVCESPRQATAERSVQPSLTLN